MALPNSSDIDNALIAKLASDAALLALCPNGVYYAEAPPGATRFVIVQLQAATDIGQFGGTAYEDDLIQVEARMLSTAGGDANAAAQRIQELLHDQPVTVPGYASCTTHRENRIRLKDTFPDDPSIRWDRRGGLYRAHASI